MQDLKEIDRGTEMENGRPGEGLDTTQKRRSTELKLK